MLSLIKCDISNEHSKQTSSILGVHCSHRYQYESSIDNSWITSRVSHQLMYQSVNWSYNQSIYLSTGQLAHWLRTMPAPALSSSLIIAWSPSNGDASRSCQQLTTRLLLRLVQKSVLCINCNLVPARYVRNSEWFANAISCCDDLAFGTRLTKPHWILYWWCETWSRGCNTGVEFIIETSIPVPIAKSSVVFITIDLFIH